MMSNIFEIALRRKLRFPSNRGELTAEQLFDLPLMHRNGFDLDHVARAVNSELKEVSEESFVEVRVNPAKADLEVKLEVVKHIIALRQAEAAQQRTAQANAALRQTLTEALARKENEALNNMTAEELRAQLQTLTGKSTDQLARD